MAQLYAACRSNNGTLVVKHVQLTAALQNGIGPFFEAQEQNFLRGIQSEIPFTGDWKPDDDELLVIDGLAESQTLIDAATQNAIALPALDATNFRNEGIRGLFTLVGTGANRRILLQNFGVQQILTTNMTLLFDGNVFRNITEPSFSIENKIVCALTMNNRIKFKSFHMVRRIFELSNFYRQATDTELTAFCGHASLEIANAHQFVTDADEIIRKSVHSVVSRNVLGLYPVPNIQAQAATIGFPIAVNAGRIQVPSDRAGTKALLSFLLDKVYRGPIAQQLMISNSTRPL